MKPGHIAFMALLLCICVCIGAAVFAADSDRWPMFRHDENRTGRADSGAMRDGDPAPIWIFPYPEPKVDPVNNDVLDAGGALVEDSPNFECEGTWTAGTSINSPNAYEGDFLRALPNSPAKARWNFPLRRADGTKTQKNPLVGYFVYIWHPSRAYGTEPEHATNAKYVVRIRRDADDFIVQEDTYTIDQASGGNWRVLGSKPYLVAQNQYIQVELSNEDADGMVVADAAMIAQSLGHVISSPAYAPNGNADPRDDMVITCHTENRPLDTVTVTVFDGYDENNKPVFKTRKVQAERSLAGVVYGLAAENKPDPDGIDERGQAQWWFPYKAENWIHGGFSSSPVITMYDSKEVAVCAAKDGQIYVLETNPAVPWEDRLIWQGPGYVLGIDPDMDGTDNDFTATGWEPGNHDGFQGAGYVQKKAVAPGDASAVTATWSTNIKKTGEYSLSAWAPPSTSSEINIPDATYTIKSGVETYTATVDLTNGGRWVPLGKFKLSAGTVTIELKNTSEVMRSTNPDVPVPDNRYAVADAIKILPANLGAFDWSSPIVKDGRIYIGCTGGRLYCFEIGKEDPVWVYPEMDQPGIGEVEGSPTLRGDAIYIGTGDGHVYSINRNTGEERWVYPSKEPENGSVKMLGRISTTIAAPSGSNMLYVAIGANPILLPWVSESLYDGRVIALEDKNDGSPPSAPKWVYPRETEEARGAFLWSSPLFMENGANSTLAVGCTDGYLICLNPETGEPKWTDGDGDPLFPEMGSSEIYSSAAGVMVDRYGTMAPKAFIGTQGHLLHRVDLRTGIRDWQYTLSGQVASSPSIVNDRLYVGDMGGLTWAFSTRTDSTGEPEGWNDDIGEQPEDIVTPDSGKKSVIDVDLFRREEYDKIQNGMTLPSDGIDPDLHKASRAAKENGDNTKGMTYPYEWGETIYVIAWNLMDPNKPVDEGGKAFGEEGFISETDSRLSLYVKSRGPGEQSDQSMRVEASEKGCFKYRDSKTNTDKVVFYAKFACVLGPSNPQSPQAPGSYVTLSVQEQPATKSDSVNRGSVAGDCIVPEHPITPEEIDGEEVYNRLKYKPQRIAINNPLAIYYKDPTGIVPTAYSIGIDSNFNTSRTMPLAQVNGNPPDTMPWVWAGRAAHGTNSEERLIIACDRSLLSVTGNRLRNFRMERSDLAWTGGEAQVINPLPWEVLPPLPSEDYPDIGRRQVDFAMAESRLDPTLEGCSLNRADWAGPNLPAANGMWKAGQNPILETIAVPRFQPANITHSNTESALRTSGYTGNVVAYIDSDGDGRLDRPATTGSDRIIDQASSGAKAEAYREFITQVHVPADYRVEVAQKTYDIGAVPHGFGLTSAGSALPSVFAPTLGQNVVMRIPGTDPVQTTPGEYDPWFKSFTAYNLGNVNLLNVRLTKRGVQNGRLYPFDLFSDTADGGIYLDGMEYKSYGAHIPARIQKSATDYDDTIVSALDPRFLSDPLFGPGAVDPILTTRTFHKPRVGGTPTVLRIPDIPKHLYAAKGYVGGEVPSLPFFSVAVPIGTPVGTYSRTLTLYEDRNGNEIFEPDESIGNPIMEAKVTVTENRITDGYIPGALRQLDINPNLKPDRTVDPSKPQPPQTGDNSPAVYRDENGNMHLFWSSSRLKKDTSGNAAAGDPWYIYKTKLPYDSAIRHWNLSVTDPANAQWWQPAPAPCVSPTPAVLASLFDVDRDGNDKPGDVAPNSVKFTSPSAVQSSFGSWLFFGGEAVRSQAGPSAANANEYRAFYWQIDPITGEFGIGPVSSTYDWTMPKYGIKGAAGEFGGRKTLWTFWYGGNNNQWRIYYNMSPLDPAKPLGDPKSWSNDGQLPIPRGLVSAAEPSIIPRTNEGENPVYDDRGNPYDALDIIYSAYSQYHKNADIYLSRYRPDFNDVDNGVVELDVVSLPKVDEILTRDPASAIYSSRHVDWDTGSMEVWVRSPDITTPIRLDIGNTTRDSQTRARIYSYEGTSAAELECKRLFRTVIINPEAGTVKFLRDPGPKATVRAIYRPRAYRLTTDAAADTGPCALFDYGLNIRAHAAPDDFWYPSSGPVTPRVDRLWTLWRRPSTVTRGTSIYYKSFRYTMKLSHQIMANAGDDISFDPEPVGPVEIDWAKKRLYFTAADHGKILKVTYPTALGSSDVTEVLTVELEEELDANGNAFGNLTSEVSNEGQVCAIRDREDSLSKLWVFWTSTRAGNTDVYYEAICPRFYPREYR